MSETTENVVKSTDLAQKKLKSFNDLNLEQLREAANAFGSDDAGTKDAIKASLAEDGITWNMYVKAFKLEGHEDIPDEEDSEPLQVDIEDAPDAEEGVDELSEVVTAPVVPTLEPKEKYLVKFVGENPYFEFGKYKFTQDKPYGIMPAEDAQRALVEEPKKFRQAFPAELQEFYG